MTYKLEFLSSALKEWHKLDSSIKAQFKKKLSERLGNPCVSASRLSGGKDHYKIKLKASGYRLVYKVITGTKTLQVIAIVKRDGNEVYNLADHRSSKNH